jgi:hypothetical protein
MMSSRPQAPAASSTMARGDFDLREDRLAAFSLDQA